MPLDPAAAAILDMLAQAGGPPLHEQTPADARESFAGLAALAGEMADVASVTEREIGGVPSLVVTPHGDGPMPVFMWIHGGGWVIGTARESESTCRAIAAAANCIVVSVDYRLAPEHKAPAATDDCLAAARWIVEHADEIGGDPTRVAVGGDSAGGNLAAIVAQAMPGQLKYQVLVYPVTDLTRSFPSYTENADGYLLTKAGMEWFVGHYLDGSGVDETDTRVSPLFADDATIAAVAPAFVITAEFDPLRDEGEAYAAKMTANGVDVVQRRFDGQIHAFYSLSMVIPAAGEAITQTVDQLTKAFA